MMGRIVHGAAAGKPTAEYRAWSDMIRRCTNPKDKRFASYGGRGIYVCARWLHSFPAFISDMGSKPDPKMSLERINNDHGYYPQNCRWADPYEQALNKRTVKLTWETVHKIRELAPIKTDHELAEMFGVHRVTIIHVRKRQTWHE